MLRFLLFYLLLINGLAYLLFWSDKRRAQRDKRRVSERTLLLSVGLGGGIGALLAMNRFHHKTQKRSFQAALVGIFLVQGLLLFLFLFRAR